MTAKQDKPPGNPLATLCLQLLFIGINAAWIALVMLGFFS